MSRDEMGDFVESLGERRFRGAQLYAWIYAKRAATFDQMTDLSQDFRALLGRAATIGTIAPVTIRHSPGDGTSKFLFRLADGLNVESVLIPPDPQSPGAEKRLTLCVSTQVGCPLKCAFCATGTMGLARNLLPGEIVDQVLQAQGHAERRISNIVFMGMGEPMLNYDATMKAIDILTDDKALNIGARHVTISTAGFPKEIRQLADERRTVKLALSLHSLDPAKRAQIMPITRTHPLPTVLDALAYYYEKTGSRPTLEYILFDGFNDTGEDVARLVALTRRIPTKVNLIPYHSIDFSARAASGPRLTPTSPEHIEAFATALRRSDVTVMVRNSSGLDIRAACGQLAFSERS